MPSPSPPNPSSLVCPCSRTLTDSVSLWVWSTFVTQSYFMSSWVQDFSSSTVNVIWNFSSCFPFFMPMGQFPHAHHSSSSEQTNIWQHIPSKRSILLEIHSQQAHHKGMWLTMMIMHHLRDGMQTGMLDTILHLPDSLASSWTALFTLSLKITVE